MLASAIYVGPFLSSRELRTKMAFERTKSSAPRPSVLRSTELSRSAEDLRASGESVSGRPLHLLVALGYQTVEPAKGQARLPEAGQSLAAKMRSKWRIRRDCQPLGIATLFRP